MKRTDIEIQPNQNLLYLQMYQNKYYISAILD